MSDLTGATPEGDIKYSLKIGSVFGNNRLDFPGRIVLTNYDTLRDYQFSLCRIDWGCVIFDEAQEIKNPNTIRARAAKGLKADFRLAVTGTPVENSLADFWSIYDTVAPSLLGPFQEYRKKYITPINNAPDQQKNDIRTKIGEEIRKTVGGCFLRRTKEDNLPELPKKIIHDGAKDKTYQSFMTGVQLNYYDEVVAEVQAAKESKDIHQIRKILLPSLKKLQSVSLHPFLINNKENSLFSLDNYNTILNQSAKLNLLVDILYEIRKRDEKVIIFIINKNLQKFLSFSLGKLFNLEIFIVNGDTNVHFSLKNEIHSQVSLNDNTRIGLIKKFEEKHGFNIICMSPLAAGVGLTVTGANNVIHLERHWNPAKEAQATDRVYRIGATKDVHVYIPLALHPQRMSFDMNLNLLLSRKTDLRDAIVVPESIKYEDFNLENIFS